MRNVLSRSVISALDVNGDIAGQILSDNNVFRHTFEFLFDRDPKHTFLCFGDLGGILMGASAQAGINSVIWVRGDGDLIARLDPAARTIVAIVDRLTDDTPYAPQCWDDISVELRMTPTKVSEIRCILDDRMPPGGIVTASSIEATKLVEVSAAIRRRDVEKDAKDAR